MLTLIYVITVGEHPTTRYILYNALFVECTLCFGWNNVADDKVFEYSQLGQKGVFKLISIGDQTQWSYTSGHTVCLNQYDTLNE